MILYTEHPKDCTKKLLDLVNKFSKVSGYKINIQKLFALCTLIMNYQKEKLKEKFHLQFK